MSNGQIVTTNGLKIALNRTFKASPDYTTMSKFKVGTGSSTPAIGDTDLGTPVDITAGVQIKSFVGGYPSLDETNMNVTIRGLLLTTDANGNSLREFGLFNTDGTPLMFSRTVYTAITKTASVQVVFIEKDKIIT